MLIRPKKKNAKSYKDCTLKGLILKSIKAGHNEARDIFTTINYTKSLDALYAEMCRLSNYGYLSVTKHNGISIYSLTQKGLNHADDPYICVKKKEEWIKDIIDKKVMAILQDNDAVKRLAYDMALKMPSSSGISEIVSPMGTPSIINSPNPINPEILDVKDPYAAAYYHGVKPIISNQRYEDDDGNPITAEEHFKNLGKYSAKDAQRRKQMAERKKLAQKYFHHHIYSNFFEAWGDLRPVYLKTGNMRSTLRENTSRIDIIAKSNPEYNRNHVERELEKKEYDFILFKIDEYGIYIIGGENLSVKLEQPIFLRF